jgi:hypothetical protein
MTDTGGFFSKEILEFLTARAGGKLPTCPVCGLSTWTVADEHPAVPFISNEAGPGSSFTASLLECDNCCHLMWFSHRIMERLDFQATESS